MVKRKICVVTGTRAEYGLLKHLIQLLDKSEVLELQVLVTGMHLSPEFGMTVSEIEKDGIKVDKRVEILLSSDTEVGVTKSVGLAMIGFADALYELSPDILLLLGDRFEILAAAASAMFARIPIGHIHGGEVTTGAYDDAIRHSITKMSLLHFVATEEYERRVVQLGESPERVFNVGGLGVDGIRRIKYLEKSELERELNIKFLERNLVITFHPVTLDETPSSEQFEELLAALDRLTNTGLIFTMPNADDQGRALKGMVKKFVSHRENAYCFSSLGQRRYFSCLRLVDAVVGNSSSGILEAPSLGTGTINIGKRQEGRAKATSVIDCDAKEGSISAALTRLYSPAFQTQLSGVVSPYGVGGACDSILQVLEEGTSRFVLDKEFVDH